jgi:hypothetical protein
MNNTWIQMQVVNIFSARQSDVVNALMKLQLYGVTDKEILNIREFLNVASAKGIGTRNHSDPYLFNSFDLNTAKNGSNFDAPK